MHRFSNKHILKSLIITKPEDDVIQNWPKLAVISSKIKYFGVVRNILGDREHSYVLL